MQTWITAGFVQKEPDGQGCSSELPSGHYDPTPLQAVGSVEPSGQYVPGLQTEITAGVLQKFPSGHGFSSLLLSGQ